MSNRGKNILEMEGNVGHKSKKNSSSVGNADTSFIIVQRQEWISQKTTHKNGVLRTSQLLRRKAFPNNIAFKSDDTIQHQKNVR